jgi:acetyl esterase/lipase
MTMLTSTFGLDPKLEAGVRAIGSALSPDTLAQSRALFEPGMDASLPTGGTRHDNCGYGEDERQVLDLCIPAGTSKPIVLFVPGGGFTGGTKDAYGHIPAFFARKGCIGAIMNYRLAPDHQWPAGSQDVARAVDWLADNAAAHGGDPARVFVVAQSAGAAHASGAIFNPALAPRTPICAAVLMSGLYRLKPGVNGANAVRYFGDDEALFAERSASTHVKSSKVKVFLTIAELDPYYLVSSTLDLMDALAKRDGTCAPLTWLKGHNHISPALVLGGLSDTLGDAVLDALMSA